MQRPVLLSDDSSSSSSSSSAITILQQGRAAVTDRAGQGRAAGAGQARPGKNFREILGYGFQDMVFRTWDLNFRAWEILGYGFQDMVFRTWDLNFGAWIFTLAVSKTET
jgi:hypothetical protein